MLFVCHTFLWSNFMNSALRTGLLVLALQWALGLPLAAAQSPPTSDQLMAQVADPNTTLDAAAPAAESGFTTEQLEQLVAPIALYPDSLLMQILMAATYPLEVIEAERWISQQPGLKGDALDKAMLDQDWDPSVKSLCALPDVLKQMSDNLDWTQDLGDAFLEQQNDLLDTVQRMRGIAYDAGNLKSSEQQVVTQNPDKIIVIQQASPEVIYVPTYSPTVVYGPTWGYPSYYYPGFYYPPPPGYGLISFGVGMAVGAAIWGGCNWGWGRNNVDIDINRYNNFNRNTNVNFDRDRIDNRGGGDRANWNHDASHRKGVNYKDSKTAQKYGADKGSNRVTRDQARGRDTANASNRAGGAQQGNRQGAGATNRQYPQSANRDMGGGQQRDRQSSGASNRGSGGAQQANRSQPRNNSAMSGSRSPSMDRKSSSRGASSRGTPSYGGGSRGGSRGGGRRR
jgi:hypothetical protein